MGIEDSKMKYLKLLLLKTFKSIFVRRDWWKISDDNGVIYACCETCFYLCPECDECHGKDAVSLKTESNDPENLDLLEDTESFDHFGIACPHKGQSGPDEAEVTI
jgi:hypothetical protein